MDVKVKALEWQDIGSLFIAETAIGSYEVIVFDAVGISTRLELPMPRNIPMWFSSGEEAKAEAQADYERRILSALEITPPAARAAKED